MYQFTTIVREWIIRMGQDMQTEKRTMAAWVFYTLVSAITAVIFVLPASLVFFAVHFWDNAAVTIFAILFLLKSPVMGWGVGVFIKRFTKEMKLRGLGWYHARLVGFLVGAALGNEIANGIGAILGALIFYFLGRWAGPKVSYAVAAWIERYYKVPGIHMDRVPAKRESMPPSVVFLLALLIFILVGFLVDYFDIGRPFLPEYLPVARVIAIVLSIVMVSLPWLLKYRAMRETQTNKQHPVDSLIVYVAFSIGPAIYGLILFFLGAALFELIAFVAASEIAGVIWLVYESRNRVEDLSVSEEG